jgi:hypothetical protein
MAKRPWPCEVTTERTPHGLRFVFPGRPGVRRARDLIGVVVVLAVVIAPAVAVWAWVLGASSAEERSLAVFSAILVTLAVLWIAGLIAWWTFGHSEIAIEDGQLVASERAGICFWVRRRPLRRLRRLEITTRTFMLGGFNGGQESRVRNQRELVYALRGDFTLYGPVTLAHGYPRAMLEAVAAALTELAESARATPEDWHFSKMLHARLTKLAESAQATPGPPASERPSRPFVETVLDQDREPPLPETRYVRVSTEGSTLRLEFPPLGWRGGWGYSVLFGALFAALPGTALVFSICSNGVNTQTVDGWLSLVCPLLFTLLGVVMVVCGLLERRQPGGSLEVSEGTVRVTEPGLVKSRHWQRRREELAAVRCINDGDGGYWLQLDLADGRRERFFASGRGLDWGAWRLRRALELPEVPP